MTKRTNGTIGERVYSIVVELAGGLGNQLFQFSFAKLLMRFLHEYTQRHGVDAQPCMYFDATGVIRDTKRHVLLSDVLVLEKCLIQSRRALFSRVGERMLVSLSPWERIIHRVYPYISPRCARAYTYYNEDDIISSHKSASAKNTDKKIDILAMMQTMAQEIIERPNPLRPVFIQGYWQHADIVSRLTTTPEGDTAQHSWYCVRFPDVQHIVKQYFTPDAARHTISLHVRRTDYLDKNTVREYPACTMKYYFEALQYIAARIGDSSSTGSTVVATVYVFSDDSAWCADELIPYLTNRLCDGANKSVRWNFELAAHVLGWNHQTTVHKDTAELALMNVCRHHILANSSFSWWGAGILYALCKKSPRAEGVTVMPSRWSAIDARKTQCLRMSHWYCIPNEG